MKDIVVLIMAGAALFALAWFTTPIDQPPLRTVRTCAEIMARATQKGKALTPAEKTDFANCTTP